MPNRHVIQCRQCTSDDIEAHRAEGPEGLPTVTRFTCARCGHHWAAHETPQLFAPDYGQAYADAPDLAQEELTLALWAEGINIRAEEARAGRGPAIEPGGYRLFFLRQAAYLDRAAHEMELALYCTAVGEDDATVVRDAAVMAADLLLHLDLDLGQVHVEGPFASDAACWQSPGGLCAYVRQEYTAWQDWETTARRNRDHQ
ncbi:hypothetical protein [Streptomyces nigrescens]|uniref:hypothetical protein n=1 Tax=Streptomyces nigrescens TaxID=1920 RepID=UPI0036FE6730